MDSFEGGKEVLKIIRVGVSRDCNGHSGTYGHLSHTCSVNLLLA